MATVGDINKEIKRVRGLKQYVNASEATVEKVARMNIWKRQINISDKFLNKNDKELAQKLFDDYLANYEFDSFSELNTLSDLIFEEVLKINIQKDINKIASDENSSYISDKMIKSLHDVEMRVLELKNRLGIGRDEDKKDDLTALEQLKKRFKKFVIFNRNEYTMTCIAEDSLVLMSDWTTKKIQDINIGDEIFGLKEKNTSWELVKQKVLNTAFKGKKEVVQLESRNKKLLLTPDHRILARICRYNSQGHQTRYFPVYDCFGRQTQTFNYIENLNDYYKGVLLGLIDSNGYIKQPKDKKHPEWNFKKSYNLCQKNDHKAFDWILNYFQFNYTKKWHKGGFKHGAYDFYIWTNHTDTIDAFYKKLETNFDIKLGYLCGFFIGDGHRDTNNSILITQSQKVNLHKINRIKKILEDLQISYTICRENKECLQFCLGTMRIPLKLPESKKVKTWNKYLIGRCPFYSLNSGETKFYGIRETKNVYDLTTETKNFIVNGFVVHNCPDCGQPTLIRRKCDPKDYEVLKHPFFCGRFYYNPRGMALVKAGIWTKEQYAWTFFTHPDYVTWCIEHEHEIPDVPEFTEEEIKEYINTNPYLKQEKIPDNIK